MWAAYFEGDGLTLRLFYPFTRIPSEPAMTRKKEESGNEAMVEAIEARKAKALVPAKPWVAVGSAMKVLPLSVVRKML